jgi:dolichol-phosphate mannosyltransferase
MSDNITVDLPYCTKQQVALDGRFVCPVVLSSGKMVDLSVVAPCYNEEAVLKEFVSRVFTVCGQLRVSFEVVLINDGSTDQTWSIMNNLSELYPELVLVKLSRNHGHQMALTAGLMVALGSRIFVLDADLQDPPELLPEMQAIMEKGYDVVYGQRRHRKGETMFKKWTASGFYSVLNFFSAVPIPKNTGDFRLLSRRALDTLLRMPEKHRFIRGMVSWVGYSQTAVLYDRDERFAGETKYPFRKMLLLSLDAIFSFSTKPLSWAGYLALFTGVFGLAVLLYTLVSWLYFDVIRGWTSVLGAVAILGSFQLIFLSLIGQYLGRVYEQVQSRPLFIIESVIRRPRREISE